jgi:hypothetical protein
MTLGMLKMLLLICQTTIPSKGLGAPKVPTNAKSAIARPETIGSRPAVTCG